MAAPYLIETYGYSKAQIGFVGSALGLAYGISKFIMGNVSDRCNPRYFLPLGLILAAIANIMLGFASSVPLLFVLMLLNGWFKAWDGHPVAEPLPIGFLQKNGEHGWQYGMWLIMSAQR